MSILDVLRRIGEGASAADVVDAYDAHKQALEAERRARFSALGVATEQPCPASQVFHAHSAIGPAHWPLLDNQRVEALTHTLDYKRYPNAPRIALPNAPALAASLEQALRTRGSTRSFASAPLSLTQLAQLLALSCGVTRTGAPPRRSQPSGGALYPIETYAWARAVSGLTPGIYHYAPLEHAIEQVSVIEHAPPLQDLLGPILTNCTPALVIVLSLVFARTQAKYGERGYRFGLLEAGHIAQSLALVAQAQGLGSLACGGFFDQALNRLLGLHDESEAALYCVLVGSVTESSADRG